MDNNGNASVERAATWLAAGEVVTPEQFLWFPATGQSGNGQHGRSGRIAQSADRDAEELTEQRRRVLAGVHQEQQPAGGRQGDAERLRRSPGATVAQAARQCHA